MADLTRTTTPAGCDCGGVGICPPCRAEDHAELQAERDRYKQALERIAHDDGDPDGIVQTLRSAAREALNA